MTHKKLEEIEMLTDILKEAGAEEFALEVAGEAQYAAKQAWAENLVERAKEIAMMRENLKVAERQLKEAVDAGFTYFE